LIWPVFVKEGTRLREPIEALPGCFRFSMDELTAEIQSLKDLGLRGVALFPAIDDSLKNERASEALNPKGLIPQFLQQLKIEFPEISLFSDVALDPYSSSGHDGLVKDGKVLNDESLEVLAQQALVQAAAGADFVCPSDMMDGRVGFIRQVLDENGFESVGILSYCAKYASALYGPFREALGSAPRFGDKKTYQMNPTNRREASREARLDVAEGADILMVKPALNYLDVISDLKSSFDLPVAAYNVSGEYAMVKAAAAKGWIDERAITTEFLISIRRAGADMIFSYHTPDVLRWLRD
jgi:porphobilinogen synthase